MLLQVRKLCGGRGGAADEEGVKAMLRSIGRWVALLSWYRSDADLSGLVGGACRKTPHLSVSLSALSLVHPNRHLSVSLSVSLSILPAYVSVCLSVCHCVQGVLGCAGWPA
jgi:hypothetical protein